MMVSDKQKMQYIYLHYETPFYVNKLALSQHPHFHVKYVVEIAPQYEIIAPQKTTSLLHKEQGNQCIYFFYNVFIL